MSEENPCQKKPEIISVKEPHKMYERLCGEQCYWCVFKAYDEPTNQENGWKILGLTVQDGIFFAFETIDGCIEPIHLSCFCNLADDKARLEIWKKTKTWWLLTPKQYREYTSNAFKEHFAKLFPKVEGVSG